MSDKNPFSLSQEITRIVLGGQAFIDQEGLDLATYGSAKGFVVNYGFDPDQPHQRLQMARTFRDALKFLKEDILEGTGLEIPAKVAKPKDPLNLLMWASGRPRDEVALWSCAVLRVMHTLLYIDSNMFLRYLPEIQRQIFGRYEKHLVRGQGGGWLLKGDFEVPLLDVKRKESKNRGSMLLKLLHKPENVAETIYDHIGIRLVAEDMLDVLLALKFLTEHNVFQAAHIKPSRTRNLVVDVASLEEGAAGLPKGFSVADLSTAERVAICERLTQRVGRPAVNPYSSSDYSAMQFTVSTLVRLPGPGARAVEKIQSALQKRGQAGLFGGLCISDLIPGEDEFTFFFAHEVQLMEKTGFDNSRMGPASHTEYKRRQREAVRRRVLRGILPQER
jgi:uncharacterized protein (TIGR04562 family)